MLRALVSGGRTLVDRALDTSEEINPRAQIEAAEEELFKVAADGGAANAVKTFAQATTLAVKMAERALDSGGNVSGITTGHDSVNAKIGGLHHSDRSEEHTSELQSLMRKSYAVFCLKKNKHQMIR